MKQQITSARRWWQHRWLQVAVLCLVVLIPTLSTLGVVGVRVADAIAPAAQPFTVVPFTVTSPIALENEQPGTTSWLLDPNVSTTFIQGYAGKASAQAGELLPLYISTVIPVDYTLDVYRIGWYGGAGARLMLSVPHLQGMAQGFWSDKYGLIGCHTCQLDPKTNLLDTHWQAAYQLYIQPDWLSGAYLIKLSVGQMAEGYIPFVVRDDSSQAPVLLNLPVMTYQAYNVWGGYSLYGHGGNIVIPKDSTNSGRAYKVSFNRPYERSAGAGDFLTWDIHTVRWLERSAIDATYTTDVDVSNAPYLLQHHRVYLDAGHDEYWTLAMRNGIEQARDAGVNLAFLGADDSYWQARLEPDSANEPLRTVTCYKVSSTTRDRFMQLKIDPMYPAHPELVTAQWRDRVVNRPENSLLGLMYSSYFSGSNHYAPDLVIDSEAITDGVLANVGLQGGQHIQAQVLGYEYDTIFNNGLTPANLVIVAKSPITNVYHSKETAYSAYYRAPSGALVFDAGSIWWCYGLDSFIPPGDIDSHTAPPNQAISDITAMLLVQMLRGSTPTNNLVESPPTIVMQSGS